MIWLKTATLLFGMLGAQSASFTDTVVPGTIADCIKYLDYIQSSPDVNSENNPVEIKRVSNTVLTQQTGLGFKTVLVIRSCVEVK